MTGAVSWPGNKEELIFPPLQVDRTTADFLAAGIAHNLAFVRPLPDLIKDASLFSQVQFLVVADSASANCKLLPRLFAYLQKELPQSVAFFSPCLLHQMSRLVVMNLERQGVCSPLALISTFLF